MRQGSCRAARVRVSLPPGLQVYRFAAGIAVRGLEAEVASGKFLRPEPLRRSMDPAAHLVDRYATPRNIPGGSRP